MARTPIWAELELADAQKPISGAIRRTSGAPARLTLLSSGGAPPDEDATGVLVLHTPTSTYFTEVTVAHADPGRIDLALLCPESLPISRRPRRWRVDLPISYHAIGASRAGFAWRGATALTMNAEGMGLLLGAALMPGESVEVQTTLGWRRDARGRPRTPTSGTVRLIARVATCRAAPEGLWSVGILFSGPGAEDVKLLRHYLDSLVGEEVDALERLSEAA